MNNSSCPKAIIWGCGVAYNENINLVKYQELLDKIHIVGVLDKKLTSGYVDSYPVIRLNEIALTYFDYVIIAANSMFDEICQNAIDICHIQRIKIIDIRVFGIPNFDFIKYTAVLESKVSIISNNCWGGTVYHHLGMKFLSPFINMFEHDDDYLKLLGDLKGYLNHDIKFDRWKYSTVSNREFPVYYLDNVQLFFNHDTSREEVENKWYDRIKRINYNNLFIMMFTEKYEIAEKFDLLNYERKICFVPFKCDIKSAYTLQSSSEYEFYEIVNGIPGNKFIDYNVLDLLYGEDINHDRLS